MFISLWLRARMHGFGDMVQIACGFDAVVEMLVQFLLRLAVEIARHAQKHAAVTVAETAVLHRAGEDAVNLAHALREPGFLGGRVGNGGFDFVDVLVGAAMQMGYRLVEQLRYRPRDQRDAPAHCRDRPSRWPVSFRVPVCGRCE